MRSLKIGITGGIGSGKSIICAFLEILGYPVYYADKRAKWIANYHAEAKKNIIAIFGNESYGADGSLNRAYLAREVFSNTENVAKINSIIHPLVAEDYQQWLIKNAHFPLVFKEAAILVETGKHTEMDKLVVVYAPKALRKARTLQRDSHRNALQVEELMAKQLPQEELLKVAHYTINNDEKELVIPQVLTLLSTLT
jgi:dephospho-CoA kinase